MFLFNYSSIFLCLLTLFSVFAINFNSLFFTWVFMELNLLLMTPLLCMKSKFFKEQPSLALKYFLIQVLGTLWLLIALIQFKLNFINLMNLSLFMTIAFILKMGIPPFHFWLPPIMIMSNPLQGFLILCVQKIIPFFTISLVMNDLIMVTLSMSALVGGILGFNQNSVMKIMAYSSMVHASWILSNLTSNIMGSCFYFLIYSLTTYFILMTIEYSSIKFISEILKFNKMSYSFNSLIFLIISMSGIPPFMGFFGKIFILKSLIKTNLYWLAMFLIAGSIFSLYFYLRLIISILLLNTLKLKDINKVDYTYSTFLILTLNVLVFILMWSAN